MNNSMRSIAGVGVLLATSACELDSTTVSSEGVSLQPGQSGSRGFAVVNSDYQSVSVSLMGLSGEVQSESFISSGSAPVGLSAPLEDVVTPSERVAGSELVLINRTASAFLTWVDLETTEVRAQLNLSTGFGSNPQDYVPLSDDKAFVPRFAPNLMPGAEAFDAGDDVLVIDPSVPEITGRIDLSAALDGEPEDYFVRPTRALMAGGRLRVLSLGFNVGLDDQVDARIISIDPETDEVTQILALTGMKNCVDLALSPSGRELAIACAGPFGEDAASGFPSSGIAILDVDEQLSEQRRVSAPELGGERVFALSYSSDSTLALATYGRNGDAGLEVPDALRSYDLDGGQVSEALLESRERAFVIGDVRCVVDEGVCAVADAETDGGVVHLYSVSDGSMADSASVELDRAVGLPPRSIGLY